jgi:serine/threonine protein kinase
MGIQDKVRRFRRGYDAMRQMDHPYIVKVHSLTDCPFGFSMDFIDGPNLRDFVGTIDEPTEVVAILLTIAQTLRHAHSRGVLHRDVKPENIIMNWDNTKSKWRPFLTDFDLAWFSTATQFTREALGVVYYASPEQQATPMSASAHAPTTDIYSFGQLCYFATTGSDPVPLGVADNLSALVRRLGVGWTAEAAETFAKLYADCTQKEPKNRPAAFDTVCDTLFRIMQLLGDVSATGAIPAERFVREVVFSTVGVSSDVQKSEGSFLTLSGKTRVTIQVASERRGLVDLAYDIEAQDVPIIAGVHNYEQVRKTLLARLDIHPRIIKGT